MDQWTYFCIALLIVFEYAPRGLVMIAAGDFNINFLENSNNNRLTCSVLNTYGMEFIAHEPRRITTTLATCIHNILVSKFSVDYQLETMNMHLSDHLGQCMTYYNLSENEYEGSSNIKL